MSYAVFFIDEFTRYVWVDFISAKNEVIAATKRFMARFDAEVGIPVDDIGKPQERPRILELRRDHEGQYESLYSREFRADTSLHETVSPPHDHNLNPIAESTIRVISDLATCVRAQCNAPPTFWPWIFRHAVAIHNSGPVSIGSSTADRQLSPYQNFTLRAPDCMKLLTFGARAVVLKPPQYQKKGDLSSRGWVGKYLGNSTNSIGAYNVWVDSERKIVTSSSV